MSSPVYKLYIKYHNPEHVSKEYCVNIYREVTIRERIGYKLCKFKLVRLNAKPKDYVMSIENYISIKLNIFRRIPAKLADLLSPKAK